MESILNYFSDATSLNLGKPALLLILIINLGLTLVHAIQELKGKLWRYFGAIAGVKIHDLLGISIFFVGLTLFLWLTGISAFTGYIPFYGHSTTIGMGAVGFLIAARLSDRFYSHILLDLRGFKRNPGLESTIFYLVEAIIILLLFTPGILENLSAVIVGIGLGWILFPIVIPVIRLFRVLKKWNVPPWVPGENDPDWARP